MPVRLAALAFLALFASTGAAHAQSAEQMLEDFRNGNDPLSQRMRATERSIVQQNLADPRVQHMYQQYLQAGSPYGYMTPEQFAYEYASHGFTADGMRRRAASDAADRARVTGTWQGVQDAERASQEAMGAWQGGFRQNSSGMADVSRGLQQRPDIFGGRTNVPYIEHAAPWVGSQTPPRQGPDGRWYQQAGDGNWYLMPGQ